MRYKVKSLIGFFQCVTAAPSVFDVVPPVGLEEYSRLMELFELPSELENIFIPTACLGDYRRRVRISSLWPIFLILLFAASQVGWEILLFWRRQGDHAARGLCAAVRNGLQRALPLMLTLTFLVVPSVSTRIFRTFLCEPITYGDGEVRRYLRADLRLSCDNEDYESTRAVAFVFMAIWPVGIPLLYAMLLWASHGAIRDQIPTSLSQATAFLWADCESCGSN